MKNAAAYEGSDRIDTCSTTVLAAPSVSRRAERAHDMKNCLSVILATTWLMERDDPRKVGERLKRLRASAERLRDLVMRGDLAEPIAELDVAVAFSSQVLAQEVVDRAHDHAARGDVRLHLVTEPANLVGDEQALREALYNLVSNAIDASPPGATVLVSTRETPQGDHVWEVRDAGCGIPPEQMPLLGRAFHTTKTGGSGIGLAVVQAAVTAHGGVLRVESRKGHGSTFTLLLPRR